MPSVPHLSLFAVAGDPPKKRCEVLDPFAAASRPQPPTRTQQFSGTIVFMRFVAVATFNRDQSLRTMWQTFRAWSFAHQQLVAINTGVVRDLLNARYYAAAQGQFISQDPSFLAVGDPKLLKQVTGLDN
jgi:hypothetical protein